MTREGGDNGDEVIGFVGLGNMGGRMTGGSSTPATRSSGYDPEPGRATARGYARPRRRRGGARRPTSCCCRCPTARSSRPSCCGDDGLLRTCARRTGRGRPLAPPPRVDRRARTPRSAERGVELPRRRHLRRRRRGREGHADDHGRRRGRSLDAVRAGARAVRGQGVPPGRVGAGHTAKLLNNFLNAVSLAATAEVMVAGAARPGSTWTRCSTCSTRAAASTSPRSTGSRRSSTATTSRAG